MAFYLNASFMYDVFGLEYMCSNLRHSFQTDPPPFVYIVLWAFVLTRRQPYGT